MKIKQCFYFELAKRRALELDNRKYTSVMYKTIWRTSPLEAVIFLEGNLETTIICLAFRSARLRLFSFRYAVSSMDELYWSFLILNYTKSKFLICKMTTVLFNLQSLFWCLQCKLLFQILEIKRRSKDNIPIPMGPTRKLEQTKNKHTKVNKQYNVRNFYVIWK